MANISVGLFTFLTAFIFEHIFFPTFILDLKRFWETEDHSDLLVSTGFCEEKISEFFCKFILSDIFI